MLGSGRSCEASSSLLLAQLGDDVYTVPLQLRRGVHRTRAGESEPKRYSRTFVRQTIGPPVYEIVNKPKVKSKRMLGCARWGEVAFSCLMPYLFIAALRRKETRGHVRDAILKSILQVESCSTKEFRSRSLFTPLNLWDRRNKDNKTLTFTRASSLRDWFFDRSCRLVKYHAERLIEGFSRTKIYEMNDRKNAAKDERVKICSVHSGYSKRCLSGSTSGSIAVPHAIIEV